MLAGLLVRLCVRGSRLRPLFVAGLAGTSLHISLGLPGRATARAHCSLRQDLVRVDLVDHRPVDPRDARPLPVRRGPRRPPAGVPLPRWRSSRVTSACAQGCTSAPGVLARSSVAGRCAACRHCRAHATPCGGGSSPTRKRVADRHARPAHRHRRRFWCGPRRMRRRSPRPGRSARSPAPSSTSLPIPC